MRSKKILLLWLFLVNVIGLAYLLCLGHFYTMAQDDHALLAKFHAYGFNSAFLYWYKYWQGRFTSHYLLNTIFMLVDNRVSVLIYFVTLLAITIYGLYNFIVNFFSYIDRPLSAGKWLLVNTSCFAVLVIIYSNFEFNTFYWLGASVMYFGGLSFFMLGTSEIISDKKGIWSFFLVGISFLFVGGSSENFAFVSLVFTSLFFLWVIRQNRSLPLGDIVKIVSLQKTLLAINICGVAFLIMILAPGNKARMEIINILYHGYKKVPLSITELPGEVLYNYEALMVLIAGKLPLILSAFPVFVAIGAWSKCILDKPFLLKTYKAILLFCLLLFLFITPTVYATAALGPLRSLTYILFFISLLIGLAGFAFGSVYAEYHGIFNVIAICTLIFWSGSFLHDIFKQAPQISRYYASEKSRLDYLSALKEKNTRGVVTLDPLYKPHFKSYTNIFRNQILSELKKHNLFSYSYLPIEFDPLFYDEISIDTSYYTNTDLRDDLKLPFSVQLKR